MYGWAHPYTFAVADGTLIYWNNYDHQVYAVAKGPSAMTVEAPHVGVSIDQSLVITGTVTDISPGTKQLEQAMRFPNGVPAVSDESMSHWMEYVYMQKARPTNATGVEVSVDVIDANGNFRNIGTTTSDANGLFSLDWMPDIPGNTLLLRLLQAVRAIGHLQLKPLSSSTMQQQHHHQLRNLYNLQLTCTSFQQSPAS